MMTQQNAMTEKKQIVVNDYQKVLVTLDFEKIGVYANVTTALESIGQLTKETACVTEESKVRVYGVITEDDGFEHSSVCPIYVCSAKQLSGGKLPSIQEVCVIHYN